MLGRVLAMLVVSAATWHRTLPGEDALAQLALVGSSVVVTSPHGTTVLDERTGAVRWHRRDEGAVSSADARSVYSLDRRGVLARRDLADGRLRWQRRTVCATDPSRERAVVLAVDEGVLLSCAASTTVMSLRESDGRTTATHRATMDRISSITPAGAHAFAILGWSDGAALRNDLEFVDRTTLAPLAVGLHDQAFLGVTARAAIVMDSCCNGRMDDPSPGTIRTLDLRTMAARGAYDARPEPLDIVPTPGPVGHGFWYFFDGKNVLIFGGATLSDFGPLGSPQRPPRVIFTDLVSAPSFFADGKALVRRLLPNGDREASVVDVATRPVRTLWRQADASGPSCTAFQVGANDVVAACPASNGSALTLTSWPLPRR
jgi:hypothetical protein